ncbi:Dystroglycan [Desmophyllum pertusum]|uniref:Dystroglycan n=1 Tax=Desmophyllum pertusum TaxID=174260 RepID=A0A9W9YQS9_9CNID|nr:Dystroglycan [Desmophyllum pertusum]
MNSSIAPSYSTVGSRMNTVRFSSPPIHSTIVTQSNATTVTRLVTPESSTIIVTPSSFEGSSVSSDVTQVNSTAFKSFSVTSKTSVATQRSSLVTPESSAIVVTPSSFAGSSTSSEVTQVNYTALKSSSVTSRTSIATQRISFVTPESSAIVVTPSSFVGSSTSSEVTQVNSTTFKSSSVTSRTSIVTQRSSSEVAQSSINIVTRRTSISRGVTPTRVTDSSVRITPSFMTSSIASIVSSRVEATPEVRSSQANSSVTYTVTSRVVINVTSVVTPSATFDVTSRVTSSFQTELIGTPIVSTSIPKSQRTSLSRTSSLRSTARSIFNATVTQSSDQTALPSRSLTLTSLASEFRSSIASSGTRSFTSSARVVNKTTEMTTTVKEAHTSRFVQVTETSVTYGSSTSVTYRSSTSVTYRSSTPDISTREVTQSTTNKTTTLSRSLSEKSTVVSRISTASLSAVSFSSRPLSSSSALPSSNTTPTTTATDTTQIIASPSSTVVVIPTTAPPNLPPRLLNNMGRVRAPAGKALHYTIPDDTFYDREDRVTTRNLSLSMSLANGTSIPKDFWMQFDIASQTLNGLPLNAHVPDGIMGEVFVLRARDRRGAEARDAFEVLVVPSEKPVVQELKVRITNEFSVFDRDVAQRLRLLDNIASYYGDADASKIRVLTFTPAL